MVNLKPVLILAALTLGACREVADMQAYPDGGCRVTSYKASAHVQHLRTEDRDVVRCTLEFKKDDPNPLTVANRDAYRRLYWLRDRCTVATPDIPVVWDQGCAN